MRIPEDYEAARDGVGAWLLEGLAAASYEELLAASQDHRLSVPWGDRAENLAALELCCRRGWRGLGPDTHLRDIMGDK